MWNGYPLVFSDTGTYLSQALNHYLGWDRPVFYSFFLLGLHLGLTTWPAVAGQALLAVWILALTRRSLPAGEAGAVGAPAECLLLTLATPLPWLTSELMPDLFTGLLILALALLVLAAERLRIAETVGLAALSVFAITAHLANLPIALGLLAVLLPFRRRLGARAPLGMAGLGAIAAPAAAVLALFAVNLVGRGIPAIAPYGDIFLLARVIEDGPGRDALARECPQSGWVLCNWRDRLPETADDFLWREDSPLQLAGGPKRLRAEAGDIVRAALRARPATELARAMRNAGRQLAVIFQRRRLAALARNRHPLD